MSLRQDPLREGSGTKKASTGPKHKYLADSINLESAKWADAGLSNLEKEFKSAKSEEKRSRIISTIDSAILRADLEASNPSITQERKKELQKIKQNFGSAKRKMLGDRVKSGADKLEASIKEREKSVTREPHFDADVIVRKIKRTENVGQLYQLMDRIDKENIRLTKEMFDAKQAQMKKFGYELKDIPEREYATDETFIDLPEAKKAAESLTKTTGKKHSVKMLEMGRFKVEESKSFDEIQENRYKEQARLVRKRLEEHEHRMGILKKAIDDAAKYRKTSDFHRTNYNQGMERLRAQERERQKILKQLRFAESKAQGPEYQAKLERLEKMDKVVETAKGAYFVARQVERRKLTSREIQGLIEIFETHHELQNQVGISPYSIDVDLLNKLKSQVRTAPDRDFQRVEWRVKHKRGYAHVVDIEESDIKKPKGFSERPTEAKKFTDFKGIGKDFQFWELSEFEYHRYKHFNEVRRLTVNIDITQKKLDEKRSDGKFVIRGKKREEEMSHVAWWQKELKRLSETTPEETWKKKTSTVYGYPELVKKAIKSGKPVPQEVIDQYPEFKKAEDARERYEKGLHTSFANRSIAINESMRESRGYKVKRQDGKEITKTQISEISDGVSEVEAIFGSMDDMFRQTDITIAHTSGKHPFLSQSGGQYSPSDKTVTMGVARVPSLAHELGHWLDLEGGRKLNKGVEIKRGNKRVKLSSIAELNTAEGNDELIAEATRRMNDVYETEQIMKTKLNTITDPKERIRIQNIKVRLGNYWYRPSEIWARLFEQYVATEAEKRGESFKVSVSSKQNYNTSPAYWTEADFEILKPMMEKQIQERIALIRGSRVEAENK